MSQYIQEAFKKFNLLEEEDFNLDTPGVEDLKSLMDDEDIYDFEDVIDPEAETEEELEDSYVGKVILECKVCHSKIYKDASDVHIDEETELANVDEECPFCYAMDGYEIIGQVAPYQETEVTVDVEPKEDEVEVEETEVEEDEPKNESLTEDLARPYSTKLLDAIDEYNFDVRGVLEDLIKFLPDDTIKEFYEDLSDYLGFLDDEVDESLKEANNKKIYKSAVQKPMTLSIYENDFEEDDIKKLIKAGAVRKGEDELYFKKGIKCVVHNTGNHPYVNIGGVQIYVFQDDIDEWFGNGESLEEGLENLDIETEHDKIHVEAEEKEDEGEEVIAPIEPAQEVDIMTDSEEMPVEEVPAEDEIESDIEDFSEEEFNSMGESYLKKVYENVNSFKTSSVKQEGNSLVVEGLINFKSGKNKKTTFKFESKDAFNGKVRFIGENLQICKGKKAFTLIGSLNESKFTPTSFRYNYRVDGNRVYGTIVNESDSVVKKVKKLNKDKEEKIKLADKYKNKKTPAEAALEEAKDLSGIEGSMTKALQDKKEEINNCSSKEELLSKVKSILSDFNTPASKRLIMNVAKSKNLESALQTVYNSILAGSNLAVDRK